MVVVTGIAVVSLSSSSLWCCRSQLVREKVVADVSDVDSESWMLFVSLTLSERTGGFSVVHKCAVLRLNLLHHGKIDY